LQVGPSKKPKLQQGGKEEEEEIVNLYFTFYQSHYIWKYRENGTEEKKHGGQHRPGSFRDDPPWGSFFNPRGLAVDDNYLYICDRGNSRIQVLDKETGSFIRLWKFTYVRPYDILLRDDLLYVSVTSGGGEVRVFTLTGTLVQTIEQVAPAWRLGMLRKQLYVTRKARIHVYS